MATYNSPGPASYTLPSTVGFNSHDYTKSKNPSWKFGVKHGKQDKDSSPGPVYFLSSEITRIGMYNINKYIIYKTVRGYSPEIGLIYYYPE